MADREETKPDQDEGKIPVFTVLKNGAILKNIYIINHVPPPFFSRPNLIESFRSDEFPDRENEEITILGRHPDCNVMLTHPSISRFHLQIHSKPSSQKLCVVDLSSVHGTWVSGKKIEPGARVEMYEGDTLRVGGSSRVYRLHWVPFSRAYDFETPPVSALGVTTTEKEEEEDVIVEKKNVEISESVQKENSLLDENKETKSQEDSVFVNIGPLYSDENLNVDMIKGIPSAPRLGEVEGVVMSSFDGGDIKSQSRNKVEQKETSNLMTMPFGNESKILSMDDDGRLASANGAEQFEDENESPQPHSLPLSAENLSFNVEDVIMSSFFDGESEGPSRNKFEQKETSWSRIVPFGNELNNLSMVDDESPASENGKQQFDNENESQQPHSPPLSAENLSFNVEDIIMSSLFGGESKSSSRNKFEQKENSSIRTMPLKNESKNLSMVNDGKPAPENGNQQFDNENRSLQPHSLPHSEENLSFNVEDIAIFSFYGSECKRPSRNKFEQKETSSTRTISYGDESNNVAMVDDGKPTSDSKSQQFGNENEHPHSMPFAAENLSLNVGVCVETQNQLVHEVKPSIKPLLALQPQNVTEREEFVVEKMLHPLEDNHSSISTEERNKGMEILDKNRANIGKVYAYGGNGNLYQGDQVTESLLAWQSQSRNGRCVKYTSEAKPNLPINHNGECCIEEKYSPGFETLETIRSISKKDYRQKELSNLSSVPCAMGYIYSSLPEEEVSSEIAVEKESQTPQPLSASAELFETQLFETSLIRSENTLAISSIWSRRGKPASFPRIKTGVSGANRIGTPLKNEINHKMTGDEIVANTLFCHLGEEEEIFTPDKENFTPNTLLMKSLKKKANVEESKHSRSCNSLSSIIKSSPKINEEEQGQGSDKENQTPKVLQEQNLARHISKHGMRLAKEKTMMKRGAERAPFQSLQLNLAGKRRSEASVVNSATESNTSVCCTGAIKNKFNGDEKKRWTMVVDINSLLNKVTMKSLQLLQGLKGTHLVIPRMVIRELDCLRRHSSLFRRATEASSVLQWIEDCMVQTRWWIHVQSSVEEGGPTAPTPPATPQSQYTKGSEGLFCRTASSIPSIIRGSSMDIHSPTTEDHILDCALHFRKMNDGQLVLLSDDVTLKIKAMAEGLICETAKEFRESLVNPFSERFLWADSSPRGLTWSCSDDVVLRERYDRCSLRSSKGECAKGLKLILLHNSHYGRLGSSG